LASEPPKPFTPAGAILLVLVHFAAYLGVFLLGSLLSDGEVNLTFGFAAVLVAPLVAMYVGLVRYAPAEGTLAALRLVRPQGREPLRIVLAIVMGAGLSLLVVEMNRLLAQLLAALEMHLTVFADLRLAARFALREGTRCEIARRPRARRADGAGAHPEQRHGHHGGAEPNGQHGEGEPCPRRPMHVKLVSAKEDAHRSDDQ